jgi:hypothetical protein
MAAGRRRLLWIAKAYGTAVRVDRRIFLFFNYFENLYDYFEIYQNKYLPLWARRKNPTVVGHGGRPNKTPVPHPTAVTHGAKVTANGRVQGVGPAAPYRRAPRRLDVRPLWATSVDCFRCGGWR